MADISQPAGWEYRVEMIEVGETPAVITEIINKMGAHRWDLVTVLQQPDAVYDSYIFKRPTTALS